MSCSSMLCSSSSFSEAIRKPCRPIAAISSSILAVMKLRATTRIKLIKHKINVTDLDHSSTGFYASLIVLTISTGPTIPSVRALNHPAFLQWREAFRTLWTCLDFEVPPRPMRCHPGVEGVIVILRIRKDRDETRKIVRLDVAEQERGRHPVIQTGAGNEDSDQQPQRIHQQMPLAPFDFFAAIIPALRAPDLGGLDRLAIDAHGTGGGLAPRFHARAFAHGLDHLGPCPVVAPLGKVVIDSALGQQIMRQHVPLAAAPVQIENRVEDFPHVDLTRAPSTWTLRGRRNQRFHDCPLLVCKIRGILLSRLVFLQHARALLC